MILFFTCHKVRASEDLGAWNFIPCRANTSLANWTCWPRGRFRALHRPCLLETPATTQPRYVLGFDDATQTITKPFFPSCENAG